MQEIKQDSIGNICEAAMHRFGHYVNTRRHIPGIFDGVKPVYRRILYTSYLKGKGLHKSLEIVGDTLKLHPHGNQSVEDVIPRMVEYGLLDGEGNFGIKALNGQNQPPAAPRYTECGISPLYYELLALLLPYVPKMPAESGYEEPQYIPLPIPAGLTFGLEGLGIGCNTRVPAFCIKSIFSAYKANNPQLLEAPSGLILDKEKSELDKIWNTGQGRITYKLPMKEFKDNDGLMGVLVEGNPNMFTPKFSSKLREFEEQGYIIFRDKTGRGKPKNYSSLAILRNYNVKKVDLDTIWIEVSKAIEYKKHYSLYVNDGEHAFRIPMKNWIDTAYKNYIRLLGLYKTDNVNKIAFDIKVYTNLPAVAKLIIENPKISEDEISQKLSLEMDVVKSITSKSIKTLMKSEDGMEAKLKDLTDKLESFKNFSEAKKVEDIISKF